MVGCNVHSDYGSHSQYIYFHSLAFHTITKVEAGLSIFVHLKVTDPIDSISTLAVPTPMTNKKFHGSDNTQMEIDEYNATKEETDVTEMIQLIEKMAICEATDSTKTETISEFNNFEMKDMTDEIDESRMMDIC